MPRVPQLTVSYLKNVFKESLHVGCLEVICTLTLCVNSTDYMQILFFLTFVFSSKQERVVQILLDTSSLNHQLRAYASKVLLRNHTSVSQSQPQHYIVLHINFLLNPKSTRLLYMNAHPCQADEATPELRQPSLASWDVGGSRSYSMV